MLTKLKAEAAKLADPKRSRAALWFFKTGKGQYGHGDKFLGLTVPQQRQLAKKYPHLTLAQIQTLLSSKYHEHRLIALFILIKQFGQAGAAQRKRIYDLYLRNTRNINNWDLVDSSAGYIVGGYLADKPKTPLYRLARSSSLWERRIAMIATFKFIYDGKFAEGLKVAKMLLKDKQDLIHKATGWMLREIGKRDEKTLIKFLNQNGRVMPRTALRYSIERLSARQRANFLRLK